MEKSNWEGVGKREFPVEEGLGKPWVFQMGDIFHPPQIYKYKSEFPHALTSKRELRSLPDKLRIEVGGQPDW